MAQPRFGFSVRNSVVHPYSPSEATHCEIRTREGMAAAQITSVECLDRTTIVKTSRIIHLTVMDSVDFRRFR